MVQYNGYCSCWQCLIAGEKYRSESTIFPFENDEKFPKRSVEFTNHCYSKIQENGYDHFGGFKGTTPFADVASFGFPIIVVPETFHNFGGVIKMFYDNFSHFGIDIKKFNKASKFVKLTNEIKIQEVDLESTSIYRMTEWWNFLLYYSTPLMVLFGASKIITKHWFLFVNFVAQLNRRNTPLLVGKLMELQQHIQIFISCIETVYNCNNFLTSKMHSLLHTISYTIKYGVLANWSAKCFE